MVSSKLEWNQLTAEMIASVNLPQSDREVGKKERMFAKLGEGHWYAIPQSMEESFRKAGAVVSRSDELPMKEFTLNARAT